jgi:hypothetical protein
LVEHELHHAFATPIVATIHVEPSDHPERHDITAHHTPITGSESGRGINEG